MFKHFILLLGLTLFLSGCGSSDGETNHPLYRKAQYYREQGNFFEAERLLRSFIAVSPKSPEGHYALASIYDENLNKPLQAAYFYEEYLSLAPKTDQRDNVIKSIERCRGRYARNVDDSFAPATSGRGDLKEENAKLRQINVSYSGFIAKLTQENRKLKDELGAIQAIAIDGGGVRKTATGKDLSASGTLIGDVDLDKLRTNVGFPREYVVQKGDSLAQISQNVYGSVRYYKEIIKANDLQSANQLTVGQKLIIPPLPKQP